MASPKNVTFLKLVLVGDPSVGKSTLCRAWNPGFAPADGYHVYHSNNTLDVRISDINTPPYSPPPHNSCSTQMHTPGIRTSTDVNLYIMILQPRQEGDHTRLTPFVMMNTDVVGLCYTASNAKTLENALNVWLPFIKYHIPSTPIVLIGYHTHDPVPIKSALISEETSKGLDRVSHQQLLKAISQTSAVHSLEWCPGIIGEENGFMGSGDVAQVLAWYGYRYLCNSARSRNRHCIIA